MLIHDDRLLHVLLRIAFRVCPARTIDSEYCISVMIFRGVLVPLYWVIMLLYHLQQIQVLVFLDLD